MGARSIAAGVAILVLLAVPVAAAQEAPEPAASAEAAAIEQQRERLRQRLELPENLLPAFFPEQRPLRLPAPAAEPAMSDVGGVSAPAWLIVLLTAAAVAFTATGVRQLPVRGGGAPRPARVRAGAR